MNEQNKMQKPSKMATCHPERTVQAKGLCASCYNQLVLNRDPAKKELHLIKQRATWAKRYSGRVSDDRKLAQRNRVLKHRYGITQSEYDTMLHNQHGGCAICGKQPTTQPLYVDHCHNTGKVRGLLCAKCNLALGVIDQGPKYVKALVTYLEVAMRNNMSDKSDTVIVEQMALLLHGTRLLCCGMRSANNSLPPRTHLTPRGHGSC